MADQTEQEQKAPCAHCGRTNWRWTGEYWFDDPATGPPSYRRSEIRCDWCAPLRMNAYYYGFSSTGVELVDRVLSAVAMAGKGYHYTGSWSDEGREDWGPFRGGDYVSWIQNAASDVAALLRERDAQIASLSAERDAAIDENIRLTNAEIETLRARLDGWRDLVINITAALNRPGGAFYEDVPRHVKELRAERDAAQQQIATLTEALKQFAECELNDVNCASVEVAARRVRNIARAALQHVNRSRHED